MLARSTEECGLCSVRVEEEEEASVLFSEEGEVREPVQTKSDVGEGSGLRCSCDPHSSRNCDLHISVSNTFNRGQHDLHNVNGSSSPSREKATLISLLSSLPQRLSFLAMHPYTSEHTKTDHRDQVVHEQSPSNENLVVRDEEFELATKVRNSITGFGMIAASASGPNTSRPVSASLRIRNRARASPFCPCFSPTMSSSDTDDDDVHVAHLGRTWSSSVAEVLRQRLAVVGEAANQLAGPTLSRRTLISGEVATVHRIVEYSHHLVPDIDRLLNSSYYWGVMDRFEAEQLLDGKPEGTFLLRDSAQTEYLFSVSFRRYQRTLHARIEQGNHRFSFDIHDQSVYSASTISELIEKYKDPSRCLFFEPQLTFPLHRKHVFKLQELCRGVIVSCTTYMGVSTLSLPSKLKQYIKQYHYTVPVRTVNLQE